MVLSKTITNSYHPIILQQTATLLKQRLCCSRIIKQGRGLCCNFNRNPRRSNWNTDLQHPKASVQGKPPSRHQAQLSSTRTILMHHSSCNRARRRHHLQQRSVVHRITTELTRPIPWQPDKTVQMLSNSPNGTHSKKLGFTYLSRSLTPARMIKRWVQTLGSSRGWALQCREGLRWLRNLGNRY